MDEFNKIEEDSTQYDWNGNSYVKIEKVGFHAMRLIANKEGLLSLAMQLESLANSEKVGILYTEEPGDLEEGSWSLEIVKTDCKGR